MNLGEIMIQDKFGAEWNIEDAIVRILFEMYPVEKSPQDIAEILGVNYKFVGKHIETLKYKGILKVGVNGYQLRRTNSATSCIHRILSRCREAITKDNICTIWASKPKKVFTNEPSFKYFNFP
jgi:hypothetical protein